MKKNKKSTQSLQVNPPQNRGRGFHIPTKISDIALKLGAKSEDLAKSEPEKPKKHFHKGPKLQRKEKTRQSAHEKRLKREGQNREDDRAIERARKRYQNSGNWNPDPNFLRTIAREFWILSADIQTDNTGRALHKHLRQIPHQRAKLKITQAVTGSKDGNPRYSARGNGPGAQRARRIGALMIIMVLLSFKKGHLVGVPQAVLLALLADPLTGEQPSRTALVGTCKDCPDALDYRVGYLTVAKNVGLFRASQVKVKVGTEIKNKNISIDQLRLKSGGWLVSINRYFLTSDDPDSFSSPKKIVQAHLERYIGTCISNSTPNEYLNPPKTGPPIESIT